MGSKSDLSFAERIRGFLKEEGFSLNCEFAVSSAHRTPEYLLEKLKKYEESGDNVVYITVAGLSDALSGVVAGSSTRPVIACPPDIDKFGWAKAFSSFMTPKGVPVLLASGPENAALAAVRILSLTVPQFREELKIYMRKRREEVLSSDRTVS
ncbi:MAG: AIR carboxylase family protein [Nitrososphaerota archaeon]|nr:AIR carboxylase family protein [Candidatus Bathyarchaeota archaeon]MDW8049046.1 AIR carboxylase family protein [Nitrososphaerota archaeon]